MGRQRDRERLRFPDRDRRSRSTASAARVFWIVLTTGITVFVLTQIYTDSHAPVAPPGPETLSRLSARQLHNSVTLNSIAEAAKLGHDLLASGEYTPTEAKEFQVSVELSSTTAAGTVPPGDVRVLPPPQTQEASQPAIRILRSKSKTPYTTREAAIRDAVSVAQERLQVVLLSLDPPIDATISDETLRNEYLVTKSLREIYPDESLKDEWRKNNLEDNRFWIEVDIEVSENQLRDLRSRERIDLGLWIFMGIGVLLIVAYGFFRLDAWTKGYLTLALGIVASILAIGSVVTLVAIR